MQSKRRTPLRKSFLSRIDKKDLIISGIFAFLLATLPFTWPLITQKCIPTLFAEDAGLTMSLQFTVPRHSFTWFMFFLVELPYSLLAFSPYILGKIVGFMYISAPVFSYILYLMIVMHIIYSFLLKLFIFYSLARFTKKFLRRKTIYLLRHLPSLLILIFFIIFFSFSTGRCY